MTEEMMIDRLAEIDAIQSPRDRELALIDYRTEAFEHEVAEEAAEAIEATLDSLHDQLESASDGPEIERLERLIGTARDRVLAEVRVRLGARVNEGDGDFISDDELRTIPF